MFGKVGIMIISPILPMNLTSITHRPIKEIISNKIYLIIQQKLKFMGDYVGSM